MKQAIEVEVTNKDIVHGEKGESCYCPIARAIRPRINGDVAVTKSMLYLYVGKKDPLGIRLPDKARAFTREFDSGKYVSPFSFSLKIPKEFVRYDRD